MVELNDIVGDNSLRRNIESKRNKVQAKIDKIKAERLVVLEKELTMYNTMLETIDNYKPSQSIPIAEPEAPDPEMSSFLNKKE